MLRIVTVVMTAAAMSFLLSPGPAAAAVRPVIKSLSVREVAYTGGDRVAIVGSGFVGVRGVYFGSAKSPKVKVVSSKRIIATAPRHTVGAVGVRVRTAAGSSAPTSASRLRYNPPLKIATAKLPAGVAGLPYAAQIKATGGNGTYAWSAASLPKGLSLSRDGILTGTSNTVTSNAVLSVTVRDSWNLSTARKLRLTLTAALPTACRTQTCASFSAQPHTVQIPAQRIGGITRDDDGAPEQVLITGSAPSVGDIAVLAPTTYAPSGVVVLVTGVTAGDDGTTRLDVERTTPAAAFDSGALRASGTTAVGDAAATVERRFPARTKLKGRAAATSSNRAATWRKTRPAAASADCDGNVSSDLHGVSVEPTLTPTLAAIWKHPLFEVGGVYPGLGGLSLYQFDLDGSIKVRLGLSMSGAGTCTLSLGAYSAAMPAGSLGAVILEADPSVTVKASGKLDLETSVTFTCGAEYRWTPDNGQSRVAYCHGAHEPLELSSDTGVDASVSGDLSTSVTLNDMVGINGDLDAVVSAGYHPTQHPQATIKGTVDYSLGACLACFWSGTPAKVTVVSGSIFDKTLYTYDGTPTPVPNPGQPVITTSSLPDAVLGQPYDVTLHTADNRNGAWTLDLGSLPTGLSLSGNTITGKPQNLGTSSFTIGFTDTQGRKVQAMLSIGVTNSGSGAGGGAIQDLSYCRDNHLDANDDGSSDAIDLPFEVKLGTASYSSLYVNNNGYVTFDDSSSTYTPYDLSDAGQPILAPFFADVDTRSADSALVTYGSSPDGTTFCVDWVGVGYYDEHADKLNSFQLLIQSRGDVAAGDADVTFNYGQILWETGDASNGTGGIGGESAVVGVAYGFDDDDDDSGPDTVVTLPGSGESGALLDGGADALVSGSRDSDTAGRYVFEIR